jgi:hypothetical protein
MKRWIPRREQLLRSRWLAPIAHHLHDDRLWHFERGSVARAVAIGLFIGLLLPVAQFLFAVGIAIWLRAHVAVAAAATLVTNPLTFPPIYWLAYRIGRAVLGEPPDEGGAERIEAQAEAAIAQQSWIAATWDTLQSAGAPLIVGLGVMAVVGGALGFLAVWLLWRHPK